MADINEYRKLRLEEQKLSEMEQGLRCPVCFEMGISFCNCYKQDAKCINGHSWHKNSKGKIIIGESIHDEYSADESDLADITYAYD